RTAIVDGLIAAFVIASFIVVVRIARTRQFSFDDSLWLLLAAIIAGPIVAHAWLGAHFPTERAALFYVPLGGLVIVGTLDWIIGAAGTKVGWALQTIGILLATVLVAHFLRAANTRYTSEWVYDAATRSAMDDLDLYVTSRRPPSPIRLGMNWVF